MEALVKFGHQDGDVEIREIPEKKISPDKILIEIKAAGVCGSDIYAWRGMHRWQIKLPIVLGHEFCGIVAQVGDQVNDFQPGERVVCEPSAEICGKCIYCLSGNYNLCPYRRSYGTMVDGAFTSFVVARPHILHRIPPNISFEHAAMTEPISVVYNALVEKNITKPYELVVIQGPGSIGLLALQVARILGAGKIIVLGLDIDVDRLKVAKKLGADYIINVQRDDPHELTSSLSDGFGADLIIDCTGVSAMLKNILELEGIYPISTLNQALELVRPNGRILKIGRGSNYENICPDFIVDKAVTIQGAFSQTYSSWEHALNLLESGQINLNPIISGSYSLSDWKEAFNMMEKGKNVKSIILIDSQ